MFITVPLIIFAGALVGIISMVWRKVPYLKKLSPDVLVSNEEHEGWWHSMFPVLIDYYRSIPFRQYKETTFQEAEKFLRKVRLMFSRIDRMSASLIHRVRRVHVESALEQPQNGVAGEGASEEVRSSAHSIVTEQQQQPSPEDVLKHREQELIIEIAKDPKNAGLYEALGDVYMVMGSFADAKEAFEAALEFKPDDADITKKLARVLAKLPREDKL